MNNNNLVSLKKVSSEVHLECVFLYPERRSRYIYTRETLGLDPFPSDFLCNLNICLISELLLSPVTKTNKQTNKYMGWARRGSLVPRVLTLHTQGSHMGVGSNPGSPTFHLGPCLRPRKAVEDGPKPWDPAPMWETWCRLLAPGFRSAQLLPLVCLGSAPMDGRSSSLSLLCSVSLILKFKNLNLKKIINKYRLINGHFLLLKFCQ